MPGALIIVVNEDRFFLSHRKEVAMEALSQGWDVTVVAKDTGVAHQIEQMGIHFENLPMNPTGMNLREELKTFRFLLSYYKRYPYSIVHHVGLKCMVWGGIAARLARVSGVVNAVSGLGTLYTADSPGFIRNMLNKALSFGMNRRNVSVIFQNHDDESEFVNASILHNSDTYFIKGSGVDLDKYKFSPIPDHGRIKVIFTGRMLKEKGVLDLIAAAEILRDEWEDKVEFLLCGDLWSNPKALQREELVPLCDGRYIKWLGHCTNIPELLAQSTVMAFPSYYREGVPKSVIEASAIGRPIVTTDSIGCRDTVEEGVNGFLIPPKDPRRLAKALEHLFLHPELCVQMGKASRQLAERDYDVRNVVDIHMHIYDRALENIH